MINLRETFKDRVSSSAFKTINGGSEMKDEQLNFLITKLKNGEYDGTDVMQAWIAIGELIELRAWRDKAFTAHPNIDIDIEHVAGS